VPLSITGDIDIRVKMAGRICKDQVNNAGSALVCKGNTPGGATRSYFLVLSYQGVPILYTSTNGTTQISASATEAAWPLDNYTAGWLRATRVASTGAVTFYTSPDGTTWTQLGAAVSASSGSLYNSPDPLWMGVGEGPGSFFSNPYDGTLLRVQILDGIAGTVAFDADFETAPAAALSFTESSANAATVTVVPGAASGRGCTSDPAHWANASGGVSGSGRIPLAHDDVRYDANSGTGRSTWDCADVGRNIDGTGSSITDIMSAARYCAGGAATWTRVWGSFVAGNLLCSSGMAATSYIGFHGRGATFTHNFGYSFGWESQQQTSLLSILYFTPLPSTTHALGGDLNTTYSIAIGNVLTGGGTFDAAGYNVTCGSFSDLNSTPARTINFGSGTWTLTGTSGTVLSIPNQANLTLAGTPSWVVAETLDAVVKNGKWRVPQYGSVSTNTTRATTLVVADSTNGSNSWQTPRPATALTDDLDIIVRVGMDFWRSGTWLHRWNNLPASSLSWVFWMDSLGRPSLYFTTNGSTQLQYTSGTAVPFANGDIGWVRVTRDRAAGQVKFYTCPDQVAVPTGVEWTQLGATVGASTAAIFDGQTDIAFGSFPNGLTRGMSAYYASVSNVIGGTPVAVLDFTSMDDYSLSTVDPYGNTWRSYQYASRTNRRVVGGAAVQMASQTGNVWATPDSAAVSITGAIDIQVRSKSSTWSTGVGVLAGKYAGGGRSYYFSQGGANGMMIALSTNGSAESQVNSSTTLASVGIQNGMACWLRVTWRPSDGRVQFFYAADSPSLPAVWTQLGPDKTIAIASIFDGTASLELGVCNNGATNPFVGDIYRVRILNGIEGSGGVVAFDADFSTLQDDTYAFRESSANNAFVWQSRDGAVNTPTGRLTKVFQVNNKTLPGTSLTIEGGGSVMVYVAGSVGGGSSHGFPALISTGGRWLYLTDFTGGINYFPSVTFTTTSTGPRNAIIRGSSALNQCWWSVAGTVTVNYADVLYHTAANNIPFYNTNGLNYNTINWSDEDIYPDFIILGTSD
jgi:hypothetical protein